MSEYFVRKEIVQSLFEYLRNYYMTVRISMQQSPCFMVTFMDGVYLLRSGNLVLCLMRAHYIYSFEFDIASVSQLKALAYQMSPHQSKS